MNGLDLKLMAFYGGSLVSVVALFSVVTRYGETYLKPPTSIGGTYPLTVGIPLDCLPKPNLVLVIQQSGVFLHAALTSAASPGSTPELTLQGRWTGQHLTLAGKVPATALCRANPQPSEAASIPNPVISVDADLNNATLTGTLTVDSSVPVAFSATPMSPDPAATPNAH